MTTTDRQAEILQRKRDQLVDAVKDAEHRTGQIRTHLAGLNAYGDGKMHCAATQALLEAERHLNTLSVIAGIWATEES